MKITRTLKISEEEFYDFLENELLSNIFKCTQRQLQAEDIKKGLHYSQIDDVARIDFTIIDYSRGEHYKIKVKSISDTMTLTYKTKAIDKGLSVDFIQRIASFEEKKHNRFMKGFSEAIYLSRMANTLYDIQNKILDNKCPPA